MNLTKGISLILILTLILTYAPAVLAASNPLYAFAEPFDGAVTNAVPGTVTVTGSKARVLEVNESQKVFQVMAGGETTVKTADCKLNGKKYITSFDISGDGQICAEFYLNTANSSVLIFSIDGNVIYTKEGKPLGGVNPNAFDRVSVAVDRKSGTYDLYVNNKKQISDWKLPSNGNFTSFTVKRTTGMTESLYLDNLYVYEGDELRKSLPGGTFLDEGEEFIDITDDLGDFSFFKSNYITHRYVAYPNTTLSPKTNEIICEKFDYTNPDKGDRIIFKKETPDDCYIDISAKIFAGYRSTKVYKYFKLSGDFMCDFDGDASMYLYQLRDSSTSTQINYYPITVNSDRSITLINGKSISGGAENGVWFNITMYLNLENHTATILYNGETIVENGKINSDLNTLNLTRLQCRSGDYTGELNCRNMEFTGLDKPYEGEEIRTSMFSSDEPIEDYLEGKTCFHYYGKNIWSNGEKSLMSAEPEYKDGELYISAEDFSRAYGVDLKISGSTASVDDKTTLFEAEDGLVPARKLAEELLSLNTFDDTNGLIITSPDKIYFDVSKETPYHLRKVSPGYIDRLSSLQYVYDYLLFDRPSKEELLEGFNKATDNGSVHPRIIATAQDFDRMRELWKTDDYMKLVIDSIISQADSNLKRDPISFVYDDALRTLNTANHLRDWLSLAGIAYQMTGDKKYADYAWKNLNALNDFPDINPGHPIDTGSYGVGIAIGYDWFYDAFTQEQRENIEMNAKRLHLNVMYDGYYGRSPVRGGPDGNINCVGLYNKWISNYNIWTNSGSVLMSLAFMDTYPELCSDFLSHCIRSLEYTFKNLYPDGAWCESTNYWLVVAQNMGYIFPALKTIYNTDFNLSKFPGTEITGITNQMLRDLIGSYAYHDCNEETTFTNMAMPFLGVYFNKPALLAARKATLTQAFDSRMSKQSASVFDALFFDSSVSVDEVKTLPRVYTAEGLELFAVHEDWTDYDGLYLASHAGPVSFYHAHNDVGDFIFDLNGQRWAYALGSEDYNSRLSENEQYRKRTEGHNTVSINNGSSMNQSANTYAPMIKSEEGEGGAYAVYDMSALYKDVNSYKRGFFVGDNYRSLTVRDEIDLNKNNSEIYWFMHTQTNAEVMDDHTVVLSTANQSVTLNFTAEGADSAEVSVMDAVPLSTSPEGKGQNPNTGIRKVAIRLVGSGKVNLTVRIGEFAGTPDTTPIGQWTAPGKKEDISAGDYGFELTVNGKPAKSNGYITVIDTAKLPDISVKATGEGMIAEIEKSDSLDTPNVVRVYNNDRSRYKIYVLPYSTVIGIKEFLYDELPIVEWSVTSEPQPENPAVNMFDNDFATRWTTLNTGESAVFDLGSVQNVDGIAAGFWYSDVRKYNIELYKSDDGANWELIGKYLSEALPEDYQIFKFPGTSARYIKLVGQGNTVNVNTNILELRLLRLKEEFR